MRARAIQSGAPWSNCGRHGITSRRIVTYVIMTMKISSHLILYLSCISVLEELSPCATLFDLLHLL